MRTCSMRYSSLYSGVTDTIFRRVDPVVSFSFPTCRGTIGRERQKGRLLPNCSQDQGTSRAALHFGGWYTQGLSA